MKCSGCGKQIGLVDSITLKMTGQEELNFCKDCAVYTWTIVKHLCCIDLDGLARKLLPPLKKIEMDSGESL